MRAALSKAVRSAAIGVVGMMSISASGPVKVGNPAPPADITLIDGTKVSLASLRGQVVVLNFWATWCAPCRTELPILDRYYQLQHQHGLQAFAVTTEGSLPLFQLKKVFAAMTMPAARKISGPYASVSAVPTNYVIDRAGKVRYAKAAAFDLDDLNKIIVPLLNEPAPTT